MSSTARTSPSSACGAGTGPAPHFCGTGGGLNPRRLRLEFGASLCKCDCHASCPVASAWAAVPVQTWRELCTCPGADNERRRQDQAGAEFPDFTEHMARFRRDSQLRRDASDAVRAEAAGKSREQIRDMYVAEFRARGLPVPPEDILDAQVDAILGNYLPGARMAGRALADLARLARAIWRASR